MAMKKSTRRRVTRGKASSVKTRKPKSTGTALNSSGASAQQQPAVQNRELTPTELLSVTHAQLLGIERMIVTDVCYRLAMLERDGKLDRKQFRTDHDAVFGAFNNFVLPIWKLQMHWRGVGLWLTELAPLVDRLQQQWGQELHKGAPIYNTGLLLFLAGDYARASQFISEAGEENVRSGEPGPSRLLVGSGLSEQILVNPIVAWLPSEVGADYLAATGKVLDKAEFVSLIEFLGQRQVDAMVCLSGIHRIVAQLKGPNNSASQLQRVRGLADVILAHESGLRRWQVGVTGELARRSTEMLKAQANGTRTWGRVDGRCAPLSPETTAGLNTLLNQETQQFDNSGSSTVRAVIAAYVTYRLRNSVMHVLEPGLNLFGDVALLKRVLGFALIAIRLSKAGQNGEQL